MKTIKFEKIQKLLKEVDLGIREIEIKRKNGKWVFSSSVVVINSGTIKNGYIHFLYKEPNQDYDSIGHLFGNETTVDKLTNTLFNLVKNNEMVLRLCEVEGWNNYVINWSETDKKFIKTKTEEK